MEKSDIIVWRLTIAFDGRSTQRPIEPFSRRSRVDRGSAGGLGQGRRGMVA